MRLVDYSYARPDPAYIKAQGFGGVMRYLSPTVKKNLTVAERDALTAQGLQIGLVWESTPDRALSGNAGGILDARESRKQADALGFNGTTYFAVDWDANEGQQGVINSYLEGAKSVLGDRVGVYGGYWVVKRCMDAGIKWAWQTYAWSGGKWDSRAQIRQVKNGQWNGTVDFNETTTDNWGQNNQGDNMAWYRINGEQVFHDNVYVNDPNIVSWDQVRDISPAGFEIVTAGTVSGLQEQIKISQDRITVLENQPPVVQTVYVDKIVPVQVDITTPEEEAIWLKEYEKTHPVQTVTIYKEATWGEILLSWWNKIRNIKI